MAHHRKFSPFASIGKLARALLTAFVLSVPAALSPALAEDDFYAGKKITIAVGSPEGSPAALAAQFYVRHFGRFIPGTPEIAIEFRSGQSGIAAANFVAAESPRDGTVLGIVGGKAIWGPILDSTRPPFDVRRLNWIGAKSQDNVACVVWHETDIESLEEARRREVKIGVTQPGTRSAVYAKLLNDLTATRFTPVTGFENVEAILKAMEERRIDGHCGSTLESLRLRMPQWFSENKVRVLVQFARNPDEAYSNVPLAYRVPRTDTGKRVMVFLASDSFLTQALMGPQDIPADRIEILRRAFDVMWNDEVVREEAARERIVVNPVSGSALQEFVAQLHGAPQDVTWIVKSVLEAK